MKWYNFDAAYKITGGVFKAGTSWVWDEHMKDDVTIESKKTTSMEDVSTRVLEKIKNI